MVKSKNKHTQKKGLKQGEKEDNRKPKKIRASTSHGYTKQFLSSDGGLLLVSEALGCLEM